MLKNKNILVTGGTGSIGSEIVEQLLSHEPRKIIVYARDDSKLFYLKQKLNNERIEFVIGDVRNENSLRRTFQNGIDVVIHAAALKHVSFCEDFVFEAVMTNIAGTQNLIDLSNQFSVETMLTISTDKAANPLSAMGATKYLAEKLTISANKNSKNTKFTCVRFGNVLGSRGSVIPAFFKSINTRKTLTVTDLEVTRFVMPIAEAASLVIESLDNASGGEIFVMKMKAMRLKDLVAAFKAIFSPQIKFEVEIIGLLPGEKMHEELIMEDESNRVWDNKKTFVIGPNNSDWKPHKILGAKKVKLPNYNSSSGVFFTIEDLRTIVENYINEREI
jgi:FlaA1/EpsC-like NDP-sugar epimerase